MRTCLLAATLLLGLSACASSGDVDDSGGPDAAWDFNGPGLCQFVPKEVANLILAGVARDPSSLSGSIYGDSCEWRGDGADTSMRVGTHRGTDADLFALHCETVDQEPLPPIDNRGLGRAACGSQNDGVGLMVHLDDTSILELFSTVGSLDQAFEVLREVATQIPAP